MAIPAPARPAISNWIKKAPWAWIQIKQNHVFSYDPYPTLRKIKSKANFIQSDSEQL
jgi:hypothetical protein